MSERDGTLFFAFVSQYALSLWMRWDCTTETSKLLAISCAAVLALSSGRGSICPSGPGSGLAGSLPPASIVIEPAALAGWRPPVRGSTQSLLAISKRARVSRKALPFLAPGVHGHCHGLTGLSTIKADTKYQKITSFGHGSGAYIWPN